MNMANMVGGINAGQLYQMDAQQNEWYGYAAGTGSTCAGQALRCRHRYWAGPVAAVLRITGANSVPSVAHPSPPMQVGPAAVVQ